MSRKQSLGWFPQFLGQRASDWVWAMEGTSRTRSQRKKLTHSISGCGHVFLWLQLLQTGLQQFCFHSASQIPVSGIKAHSLCPSHKPNFSTVEAAQFWKYFNRFQKERKGMGRETSTWKRNISRLSPAHPLLEINPTIQLSILMKNRSIRFWFMVDRWMLNQLSHWPGQSCSLFNLLFLILHLGRWWAPDPRIFFSEMFN